MKNSEKEKTRGSTALVVFLRFPRPGRVKSRLAASLGQEKAANFYRLCAEQLLKEISSVSGDCRKYLFYIRRRHSL